MRFSDGGRAPVRAGWKQMATTRSESAAHAQQVGFRVRLILGSAGQLKNSQLAPLSHKASA
jgi:hypothetical protein